MKSRQHEYGHIAHSNPRAGLLAVGELLLMFALLAGLIWAAVQFMAAMTNVSSSALKLDANCSERCVTRMTLTQDGDRLWVYRRRHGVVRLNLLNGDAEQSLPLMGMELTALAHGREGSTTMFCGADGTVALFRDSGDPLVAHLNKDDMIVDASVSHDGTVAACVASSGRVFGWNFNGTENSEFQFQLPLDFKISQLTLNRDGRRMFLASHDGIVSIHESITGARVGPFLNVGEVCTRFAWSDDERLVGIVTTIGLVRVYDIVANRIVCEAATGSSCWRGNTRSLQISPDGRRMAISTDMSTKICILDLESGEASGHLQGHIGTVHTLQFAPTSDRLYSGSYDGTIREWSLQTYSQLRTID